MPIFSYAKSIRTEQKMHFGVVKRMCEHYPRGFTPIYITGIYLPEYFLSISHV